jgi:transcriptional regulator with XRE-family HTH domain
MPKIKATKRRSQATGREISAGPPPASIAARIRSIRRRKGVTLEQLSNDCALDRSYLSRVERGHKTPSIATLMKIGEALGVQMAHLFGETVEPGAITVIRHTQYKPFPGPPNTKDGFSMVIPQSETRRVSLVIVSPGPETTLGPAEHPGEEIIFALEGQAEVSFADRNIILSEGDCVHFDGHLKHAIRKAGHGHTRALVFVVQESPKGARGA